ncbi:armadillo-like helical domain containing protein 1 [Genypterus blacodes]|uniref:armadillo-like helical domain containing protein 1 n=1 Tax=Genypterus blacodes TaxID=154954 RepID=UPI003F766CAE
MPAQEEAASIGKVLSFLADWDRGDGTVRGHMLSAFVSQNCGRTFVELELQFAQVASLYLARLTTWMRLTYMFGTFLGLQLKAIGVFLSASCHDQYLMEFLEDGGIPTLLDILSRSQSKEEDKTEVLQLLLTISNAGRKYKEIICESHGVRAVAECMAKSNADEIQVTAWMLLDSLSKGNPKYQSQVHKSLNAITPNSAVSSDRKESGSVQTLPPQDTSL